MREWLREHGLLVANLALFLIFFGGMVLSGVPSPGGEPSGCSVAGTPWRGSPESKPVAESHHDTGA
jgi:hypothetical protein